jgi:hypothetical protein
LLLASGLVAVETTNASQVRPASPPEVQARAAQATVGPICPKGYRRKRWTVGRWRGWYGCVKHGRERKPTGCPSGYVLQVKKHRGAKAYRCAISRAQYLINTAWNEAYELYQYDRYSTQ